MLGPWWLSWFPPQLPTLAVASQKAPSRPTLGACQGAQVTAPMLPACDVASRVADNNGSQSLTQRAKNWPLPIPDMPGSDRVRKLCHMYNIIFIQMIWNIGLLIRLFCKCRINLRVHYCVWQKYNITSSSETTTTRRWQQQPSLSLIT